MKSGKRIMISVGAAALALLGSGCGYPAPPQYGSGGAPVQVSDASETDDLVDDTSAVVTDKLVVASLARIGSVVTDGNGWVLYRFDKDTADPSKSNCTGACVRNWPPALTDGNPQLAGIPYRAVGLVIRPNGTRQLTFDGWPLYRHAGDTKAGEFKGHGANAAWFAVAPDGKKKPAVPPGGAP